MPAQTIRGEDSLKLTIQWRSLTLVWVSKANTKPGDNAHKAKECAAETFKIQRLKIEKYGRQKRN